jgi:FtsZ-binding cell division protein ZapB
VDDNGKLEHRTQQAFDRMHKRVKKIEDVAISRQQLEDLVQLAPKIEDVLRRVTRIENAMVHWQDQREALHKNAHMIAEECCFIRERLLTVEGRIPRAGPTATTAKEEEAEGGS